MPRGLLNIKVVKRGEEEVLATVQLADRATREQLRQEITTKLGLDPHVSLQMLLADKFLIGPGNLQQLGLTDGCTVAVLRKRGLAVTGSADHTAMVWDCKSGKTTYILKGHTDMVHSANFSPDNRFIATGSQDSRAKIYTLENGSCVATLEGHKDCVSAANFSPDGSLLLTGSWDKTAKLWCLPSTMAPSLTPVEGAADAKPECVRTFDGGHNDGIISAVFAPNCKFVATGSLDGTAKVWGVDDGKSWATMKGHTGPIRSVAFSPDGNLLVTSSEDVTAKVWNAVTGACKLTLEGHKGSVTAASFSPDGTTIITASRDKQAKVWDAKSGQCLHTLSDHSDGLYAASFSQNGRLVLTCGSDKMAKVWTLGAETWQCSQRLEGHREGVRSASFSAI